MQYKTKADLDRSIDELQKTIKNVFTTVSIH